MYFEGEILFLLSGFFLYNMEVHVAADNAFSFWSQQRKEQASAQHPQDHSHNTFSLHKIFT